MLARSALDSLNSGQLLGIVAQGRALDIQSRFLQVADPVQPDGRSADVLFDDAIVLGDALGRTVPFRAGGETRSFIVIKDAVIIGRESIRKEPDDGTRAPVTLLGVLVHELTHARNLAGIQELEETLDTDTGAYADTALAQARSATGTPTVNALSTFVDEMVARHLHWIVLKERAGTPGSFALQALDADELAAAALFYFDSVRGMYDANGYGAGISAQGDDIKFRQLELWMRLAAAQSFSDVASQDEQSTLAFQAAAQRFADRVVGPGGPITAFLPADGLFPLPADFR